MSRSNYSFEPIGFIRSVFKDKFGIPRQSGLVQSPTAVLKLRPDPHFQNAVKTLNEFTHLWVVFVFHGNRSQTTWKPSIRPPRLGGAKKVGVFASRSPHRPNPIGLSAVRLLKVDCTPKDGIELQLEGADLLDGTPVLDIKPYLPYADSIPSANAGWADTQPDIYPVHFSNEFPFEKFPQEFLKLVQEILQLDPRPAFQKQKLPLGDPKTEAAFFGIRILDWDVKWKVVQGTIIVTAIVPWTKSSPAVPHPGNGSE